MTAADPVDVHDPEGAALFLEERARVSAHLATIPYSEWPRSADVQRHFALRFTQIATLLRQLRLDLAQHNGNTSAVLQAQRERDVALQELAGLKAKLTECERALHLYSGGTSEYFDRHPLRGDVSGG